MRNKLQLLLTLALGLGGASHMFAADVCASTANLVQNCGFETGDFTDWTVSGTDSAPSSNGLYYGIESTRQYSGNYAAYFGAIGGDITLSQTLSNLVVSDIYTVTIEAFNDITPNSNYVNNLILSLGPVSSMPVTQVSMGNYTVYSLVVGADSANPVLGISTRNDAGFWNVDSVTVTLTGTPEPAAAGLTGMALLVLGGGWLGARRRRA